LPTGGRFFSSQHNWIGSRAQTSSYTVSTQGSFCGGNQPQHDTGHSSPSSAAVNNECNNTSTVPHTLMAWRGIMLPLLLRKRCCPCCSAQSC